MEYGNYTQIEERIQKACAALLDEPDLTVAAAARQFFVPVSRLRHRAKGRTSKIQREGVGQRLNKDQHRALEAYIQRCDKLRMPALIPQLINAAQRIIDLSLAPGQTSEPLSKNWIAQYLKKYPHMKRLKQKTKEIDRSASEELQVYRQYFREFKEEVDEKDILPGNIYNIDETGFRISIGGNQWIITMDIHRLHHSPSDTNRDYTTSVEAVSGDRVVVEPMMILKDINHLEKWYIQISLPDNYLIGTSNSGYTNDTLFIEWIKHFDRHTRGHTRGVWRLLIFDGYSSYLTKEFIDYCDTAKIMPFSLPAHSSQHL